MVQSVDSVAGVLGISLGSSPFSLRRVAHPLCLSFLT